MGDDHSMNLKTVTAMEFVSLKKQTTTYPKTFKNTIKAYF